MQELIKITENNGKQVVSARELYEFLGFDAKNWSRWYRKNIIDNEFAIKNEDYVSVVIKTRGSDIQDFAISINFAKKISMMSRTKKGEDARDYFIACEDKLKEVERYSIPTTFAEALQLAADQAKQIELQAAKIEEDKPKVEFAERFKVADTDMSVATFANILTQNGFEIGRNNLFKLLETYKIIYKDGSDYIPYRKYSPKHVVSITQTYAKGEYASGIRPKIMITPLGATKIISFIFSKGKDRAKQFGKFSEDIE